MLWLCKGPNGLVTAVNGWFKLLTKAEGEFYNAPCTEDVEKALVELRKKFEARLPIHYSYITYVQY